MASRSRKTDKTKVARDVEQLQSKAEKLISAIPGFASGPPIPIDEEKFYNQVVPVFEKARDEIVEIVARDQSLARRLASMRLVIVDNRASDKLMLFWVTSEYFEVCFCR